MAGGKKVPDTFSAFEEGCRRVIRHRYLGRIWGSRLYGGKKFVVIPRFAMGVGLGVIPDP